VTARDIVSGFAGARPLVSSDEKGSTSKLARDDVIEVDPGSGLISIMGGKWTTYRAMAADTIDCVQQALGLPRTESHTCNHVLYGGQDFGEGYWEELCRGFGTSKETALHLASKFGTAAEEVLMLGKETPALREPLLAGRPAIRAEVVYSVRHEMAATIEDVLARRIGLQLYSWKDAIEAAPVVGSLIAAELEWNRASTERAITSYAEKIHHLLDCAGLADTAHD
jgi:glycerol-3-phosphate dehydrogenase